MQSERLRLAIIFCTALILRGAVVVLEWQTNLFSGSFFGTDSVGYDALADSVLAGQGFSIDRVESAFRTPVYPLFLAAMYALVGKNFLIIGLAQSAVGAAACSLVYKTASLVFDRQSAFLAGMFCAVAPNMILWTSGYILTESIYIFLVVAAVYCLVKLLSPNGFALLSFLTGLLLALASLTRPVFLYFSILAVFYLIWHIGWRKGVIVGVVFMLPIGAWALRNYQVFGTPVFTTTGGGYVLYEYHNPYTTAENGGYNPGFPQNDEVKRLFGEAEKLPEVERDRLLTREAVSFALQNPLKELRLTFNRFINVWRPTYSVASTRNLAASLLSYLPMMLFAVPACLYFGFRTPQTGLLFLFLLYHFLFHLFVVSELRFRFPLEPILMIYAAVGFYGVCKKFVSEQKTH